MTTAHPSLPPPPPRLVPTAEEEVRSKTRRRRRRVIVVGTVLALLAAAIVVDLTGGSFPEEVGDVHRIENLSTRRTAEAFGGPVLSDEIETAFYGQNSVPQMALVILSGGMPAIVDIGTMARGMAAGMCAEGGETRPEQVRTLTRDGVRYACFPFGTWMFPGEMLTWSGYTCLWWGQERLVMLLDSRADSLTEAADDAAMFASALG